MATARPHYVPTDRDLAVLASLDRCPLTAPQLLKVSATFDQPFGSERSVRERLLSLCRAGLAHAAYYATDTGGGAPKYYRLSRAGFALLHGDDTPPPAKRYFAPLPIIRHFHTRSIADFVVHTVRAAHATGVQFTSFYRENALRLKVGTESLFPDCSFQLILPDGREFNYLVELDNGTERVQSPHNVDSWTRKLRLYHELYEQIDSRFRLLVVCTRSDVRMQHILRLAAENAVNQHRRVVLGSSLRDYLAQSDPLAADCFRDHRGSATALLPTSLFADARPIDGR